MTWFGLISTFNGEQPPRLLVPRHAQVCGSADYFRADVAHADVRTLYTRMIERQWISPDAAIPGSICVTRDGHDLLLAAFTALIRLVDEGHGALEISLLFSLASKRLSHEDDD